MRFSIENTLVAINKEIESYNFGNEPKNLYEPIEYIMGLGGKRLRPLLTLLSHNLFSDSFEKVLLPAIGVEVFHNFTLLHDDIMDNAPLRRGKPTVHEKWNQNVAILSGDVMLVKSYELLLNLEDKFHKKMLSSFNACAAAVCEGQQLDVNFELSENISLEEYIHMISLKTAALLGFCMELGAVAAETDEKNINLLKDFGINIGIAFQLQDDLLDVYGDKDKFGKKTGGDILAKKKTFLLIKALEQAKGKDLELLRNFVKDTAPVSDDQVKMVRKVYDNVNIQEQTQAAIQDYSERAVNCLTKVNATLFKKASLKTFVGKLMVRES